MADEAEVDALIEKVRQLEAILAALQQVVSVRGGDVTIRASGTLSLISGGAMAVTCGQNMTLTSAAALSLTGRRNVSVTAAVDYTVTAGATVEMRAGKEVMAEGGEAVQMRTPNSGLYGNKAGDLGITGKNIKLSASGKLSAKASGDFVMRGSRILAN